MVNGVNNRLVGTVPPWFHRNNSTDLILEKRIPLRRNYQQQVSRPSPGTLILIFLNVLVEKLEPPDDAPEVPALAYEPTQNAMPPPLAYDPTPPQQRAGSPSAERSRKIYLF